MNSLQEYLACLQEALPFGGVYRRRVLSEVAMHLQESWEEEQKRGIPAEEALTLVLKRFGAPNILGGQFAQLERERRAWLGKQCWQRALLFLAPLLFCYFIAALAFFGYQAPRLAFIHLTNGVGSELEALHLGFVGVLLLGWLLIGGPLSCVISGVRGMLILKSQSCAAWLNLLWAVLGLALLLFGAYSLITG